MKSEGRLFILDANALLHRAWHALPPLTNPDGQIVNAVYGVLMITLKLLQEEKPDAFVACWDTEAPTFRHEAYEAYKAHREEQVDELYAQIPLVKEGLALLGIDSLEKDGFEADDLLGTIADKAQKQGWEVVIITGDRDALQLVRPGIRVMAFKKGVSETVLFDEDEMQKQYGLSPKQFLEYKAMRGDPSDNIPGIKGIGEKGATQLLQAYGDLKGILKAAHDPESTIPKAQRAKLLAAEDQIPDILKLVEIHTEVPIRYTPKKGSAAIRDLEELLEFLRRMGFRSMLARMQKSAKADSEPTPEPKRKKPKAKPAEFSEKIIENLAEAKQALKQLESSDYVSVSTETDQEGSLFAGSVHGFALADESAAFFFTDARLRSKELRALLVDFFKNNNVRFAAHDAKTEMRRLSRIGFAVHEWAFDTMLAAYLLSAGERNHDLASIGYRWADVRLTEDASSMKRAQAVAKLVHALQAELDENALRSVLERFDLPLVPILLEMEDEGIKVDVAYLESLSEEFTKEKARIEKEMYKLVGKEFNPASPIQLAEILFQELQLPTKGIKRGKTGYSTASSELEKLRGTHPMIELIEEHRQFAKLLSTYVDVLPALADENGRIHTTFNQAVAATGRLSSTDPNLQNIPIRTEAGRKIRKAFIAEKGCVLLSCDYSQIELRIAAALAKDTRMLEAFERGEDIHTATAAAIWNEDESKVTKDQRRIAKAINFGLIFGQGPLGLAQAAGIPFAHAKKFIAAYFDVYKGIKTYMDETKLLAKKLGYVETLFGRRRYLPEIHSQLPQLRAQAERMAINMPVQGTDADLMKLAMIEIHKELPKISKRARMLLQVHDELVFEVPENEAESIAKQIKDIMEQVESIGVPIVVEAKSGKNWEDMKPLRGL